MNDMLPLYFAGGMIGLAIFSFVLYLVIKAAVSAANSDTLKQLKILNKLKAHEMKRHGATEADIQNIIAPKKSK